MYFHWFFQITITHTDKAFSLKIIKWREKPGSSTCRTEARHADDPLQCAPLYDDVLTASKLKCVLEFEILQIYVCPFDATALGSFGEKYKITNHHVTLGGTLLLNVTVQTVNCTGHGHTIACDGDHFVSAKFTYLPPTHPPHHFLKMFYWLFIESRLELGWLSQAF